LKNKSLLLLIFILAFSIRMGNILLTSQGPAEIHDDAVDYHWYAVNLINNKEYVDSFGDRATRMPGYPMFLAGVYYVFGQNVLAVQIVQSVLNAFACLLIFFAALRLTSKKWSLAAAITAALYFDFFTGSARILSESVYVFLLTFFIFLWIKIENRQWRHAFGLGALIGLSVLFRPESLFFGLAAGLFILSGKIFKRLAGALVFYLGIAAVLSPWVIRNYVTLNAWVPLTSRAGASAYVGLQWHMSRLGVLENEKFEPLSPSEVEDGHLHFEKAKTLYKKTSIRNILKSVTYNFSVFFYPFHPWFDWTLVFCSPFWLLGAYVSIKRRGPETILLIYMSTFMLAYIFFGATAARYREPLAPATLLFGAVGITYLESLLQRKKFLLLIYGWLAFNIVFYFLSPNIRRFLLVIRDNLW
jgi:4-amino-4-deoxy-L-arabinose transferase-like glycosyltransferase